VLLTVALAVTAAPEAAVAAVQPVSPTPAPAVAFDGRVYTSTYVGDTAYLGGSFQNAIVNGKKISRKWLAAVNLRTGALLPWAPVANGNVTAIAASGSSLYIGGKFTRVGGQARGGLASVNTRTGAVGTFNHSLTGGTAAAHAMVVSGGRLYLGGQFSYIDGRKARHLTAFKLTTGARDTAFLGDADAQVKALAVQGSRLYVGGGFKRLNNVNIARFAAVRLSDGRVESGFRPNPPYPVWGISVASGRVYAGQAGPGGRLAGYRTDGKLLWSVVTDGDVQAMGYLKGDTYAGGHYDTACPIASKDPKSWCPTTLITHKKMSAYNPSNGKLLSWNPKANGVLGTLTIGSSTASGLVTYGGELTSFNNFVIFRS
jgi:hypothetical protein